ncbi:MAG: HEAT repeat domain-containing protein [Gammaproteobacteria bacterium]|nr:HEAT repeat domain-containing protein [Gammaproteobacteria bacterium]
MLKFFGSMKAEKLLGQLLDGAEGDPAKSRKVVEALSRVGAPAVPKLLASLEHSSKKETVLIVEVLSNILDNKTLGVFIKGLESSNQRIISGLAWAMSTNDRFDPNKLLAVLTQPDINKVGVIAILSAHKKRLNLRALLTLAYELEPNDKAALFRIIADMANAAMVPELINRLEGKDPLVRVHLMSILAGFDQPAVHRALEKQLSDRNKLVKQAALNSLAKVKGKVNIQLLCSLLQDPELDVQSKAVDVIIAQRHPDTIKYLVEVLKDESEYARRSAVEVLNEIGDADSIKYLLDAIKDEDWWVRSRAGDALAKIGGPKVVEAVLVLVRDEDEEIRRSAVEILNSTKDERAVLHLMTATEDKDWWVRERSADALAEIGDKKALPALRKMLTGDPRSIPAGLRALAKMGDHASVDKLVKLLGSPEREIKIEAIKALASLTEETQAELVRQNLASLATDPDATINKVVLTAIENLDVRFSPTAIAARQDDAKFIEPGKTLLMDAQELHKVIETQKAPTLDISTIKPGDVIEGRYKYIQKIGKGAFGTVLLMEDTVVDEQLILKFLNPNVSSDEEMLQRFVHELRYSRKITHKNVIRIFDFLHLGGHYAISMEYFPSHTLGQEVVEGKPLPITKAVGFAMDIATGMTVAHQAGIVHRDLKPANILINDEGLLKIVDFGVAAARSSGDTQLTKTGYVIGSPKYMAPEQILGKKVDEKADIYSVGVILYEMLTGVPPYTKGDHMSVMYQHVQGKAQTVRELNRDIPEGLNAVVSRAMEVDRSKRFVSMDDLRRALEEYS